MLLKQLVAHEELLQARLQTQLGVNLGLERLQVRFIDPSVDDKTFCCFMSGITLMIYHDIQMHCVYDLYISRYTCPFPSRCLMP